MALYVSPQFLLGIDVVSGWVEDGVEWRELGTGESQVGCLGSLVFLMVAQGSETGLVASLVFFGLFLATVLPATLAYVESLVRMGPSATSVIVVGASLGEMAFPVVVGHLFETLGPGAFVISGLSATLAMLAIALAIQAAAQVHTNRSRIRSPALIPRRDRPCSTFSELAEEGAK